MQYRPRAVILMALLAVSLSFFNVSQAGELRADPWTRPPAASPPLTQEQMNFDTYDEEGLPKLTVLAEQGHILPVVLLAVHHQETRDFKQAIHWRREAVKLGHIASAFELAQLYFPLGGTLGRERLPIRPDIVTAACWHAIGIAGIPEDAAEDADDWPQYNREQAIETLSVLEALMLPFEKAEAEAILVAWPDSLPPEGSSDSLAPENADETEPLTVDALIPLLYGYLEGKEDAGYAVFQAAVDENLFQATFETLQEKAASGDDDARYAVAWLQLVKLGTDQEKTEALEFIRGRAEQGDAKACVHLAWQFLQDDGSREEATRFYRRAAEQGRADAMLGLAYCLNQDGDEKAGSQWTEKAAEAGNIQALMALVEAAESKRDVPGLVKWMTIFSLRHPDPHVAYRSRVMLGMFMEAMEPEEMAEAMWKAEEWHTSHPR